MILTPWGPMPHDEARLFVEGELAMLRWLLELHDHLSAIVAARVEHRHVMTVNGWGSEDTVDDQEADLRDAIRALSHFQPTRWWH